MVVLNANQLHTQHSLSDRGYEKVTRNDLVELADKRGIPLSNKGSKQVIIDQILSMQEVYGASTTKCLHELVVGDIIRCFPNTSLRKLEREYVLYKVVKCEVALQKIWVNDPETYKDCPLVVNAKLYVVYEDITDLVNEDIDVDSFTFQNEGKNDIYNKEVGKYIETTYPLTIIDQNTFINNTKILVIRDHSTINVSSDYTGTFKEDKKLFDETGNEHVISTDVTRTFKKGDRINLWVDSIGEIDSLVCIDGKNWWVWVVEFSHRKGCLSDNRHCYRINYLNNKQVLPDDYDYDAHKLVTLTFRLLDESTLWFTLYSSATERKLHIADIEDNKRYLDILGKDNEYKNYLQYEGNDLQGYEKVSYRRFEVPSLPIDKLMGIHNDNGDPYTFEENNLHRFNEFVRALFEAQHLMDNCMRLSHRKLIKHIESNYTVYIQSKDVVTV